ncbi:magnesium transporter [Calothrix sp. UHCC 0171]|uniref:magnesium transporter n=1 Tax=Calothrix sp. UHCC 0171 TaxID=3110245 RepID=UPI002B203C06|nr:magnesium transporter [Calothrix sp. UHCC 0171]MEA5572682.1 magnesium transporter [Calothrix sp. UHCC 0171]
MLASKHFLLETAAQHLVKRVPLAQVDETVASILSRLTGTAFDCIEAVYIINDSGHLWGFVRLLDLLGAPQTQILGDIMTIQPPTAHPDDDQEYVAGLAVKYGMTAVPVVDGEGNFLGVVPLQSLITILRREHIEDLNRLTGIVHDNSQARQALEAAPLKRAQDRLPWLLVGLLGSILATFVVSRFEQTLEARIFVAFFVPGIVYLADAIGTQTEAIVVRGLSFNHTTSLRGLLMGELWTGLLIGIALGGLSFPLVLVAFHNFSLAVAVALTIITAGGIATSIGLLFPWLLQRLGKDPAFGSGPVATIIQDVMSLLIYFAIVQVMGV